MLISELADEESDVENEPKSRKSSISRQRGMLDHFKPYIKARMKAGWTPKRIHTTMLSDKTIKGTLTYQQINNFVQRTKKEMCINQTQVKSKPKAAKDLTHVTTRSQWRRATIGYEHAKNNKHGTATRKCYGCCSSDKPQSTTETTSKSDKPQSTIETNNNKRPLQQTPLSSLAIANKMTKIDKQGEVEDQNERTEYDENENENGSSSNGILAPLFKWPTSSGNVLVKEKRPIGRPSKKQMAIEYNSLNKSAIVDQTGDTQEHLLANFIAHLIETTKTEMALAAIRLNFDNRFSSFEHRKVHVELMLLNYLEICAQINEGNQKDPAMLAKAMTLGIEAMRLAEDENNTAMANILVKQVDSTLKLVWLANIDLINHHPLHGMRKELAKVMCAMLKEKAPKWEMVTGRKNGGKKSK